MGQFVLQICHVSMKMRSLSVQCIFNVSQMWYKLIVLLEGIYKCEISSKQSWSNSDTQSKMSSVYINVIYGKACYFVIV